MTGLESRFLMTCTVKPVIRKVGEDRRLGQDLRTEGQDRRSGNEIRTSGNGSVSGQEMMTGGQDRN